MSGPHSALPARRLAALLRGRGPEPEALAAAADRIEALDRQLLRMRLAVQDGAPWLICPSSHCGRAAECRSPAECSVRHSAAGVAAGARRGEAADGREGGARAARGGRR